MMFKAQSKNPFDAIMLLEGVSVAIEFKWLGAASRCPFAAVEPHQKEGLREFSLAGGSSWIVIGHKAPVAACPWASEKWAYAGNMFVAVAIPIYEWLCEEQQCTALGERSVEIGVLSRNPMVTTMGRVAVPEEKGRHWEVWKLLDRIDQARQPLPYCEKPVDNGDCKWKRKRSCRV